ncbi:hypothetical protein LXL04_021111 [Taraxacum kok-saghyz]
MIFYIFRVLFIVVVKPKPPPKHIQNGFEDDEEELVRITRAFTSFLQRALTFIFSSKKQKFQLPELNSGWKKKLFIILHEKLKIPDMNLMAIFSLSPKVWTLIVMWFILAPITHRWDVGPLYILGSGFAIIFLNLGHRQHGDMSAYSIFNEDFRELPGTFNANELIETYGRVSFD